MLMIQCFSMSMGIEGTTTFLSQLLAYYLYTTVGFVGIGQRINPSLAICICTRTLTSGDQHLPLSFTGML